MASEESAVEAGEVPAGYYCPCCKVFYQDQPKRYRVSDLGLLSGRQGVVTECQRCGWELHFVGLRA